MKLLKNIIYEYEIELKTGMHIGGTKEAVKIGGTDSPVIRSYKRLENGEPEYMPIIPGSSLKGKLRSVLDLKENHVDKGKEVKTCPDAKKDDGSPCLICTLFGVGASDESKEFIRSRLIFRDAYPSNDTLKWWNKSEDIVEGTEVKGENVINRITSTANPRFIERVPAGSKFGGEIILSIYDMDKDNEEKLKKKLKEGIELLKDSYLGGSGSRGYGKIEFKLKEGFPKEKKAEDYEK